MAFTYPAQIAFKQRSVPLQQHFSQIRILERRMKQLNEELLYCESAELVKRKQDEIDDINQYGFWQVKRICLHTESKPFVKFHIKPFKRDSPYSYLNKMWWIEFSDKDGKGLRKWLKDLPDGRFTACWYGTGKFSSASRSNLRFLWTISTNESGQRFCTEQENSTDTKGQYKFKTIYQSLPLK